jgi:hypothetical protein
MPEYQQNEMNAPFPYLAIKRINRKGAKNAEFRKNSIFRKVPTIGFPIVPRAGVTLTLGHQNGLSKNDA